MDLTGTVVGVSDAQTVNTQYGDRQLANVQLRQPDAQTAVQLTLWGDWAETATHLTTGMTLRATSVEESSYNGDPEYATTSDSFVVVEPSYLVNVTAVRSWIECPRIEYLNRISGTDLNYPIVKGTIVHQVFSDLLRGVDVDDAVEDRVTEAGLELDILGRDPEAVTTDVRAHAEALQNWLQQGTLTQDDEWRSEYTFVSKTYGLKGRADALRRNMPVELKTGKNTRTEPRFKDKVQAAAYGLLLEEEAGVDVDTGVVLYSKNATLNRQEQTGDLHAAKEFSLSTGLYQFIVRERNRLASMAVRGELPTGYEADADCERCFQRDQCMVVAGRLEQESKAGEIGQPVPGDERAYFEEQYAFIEAERRAIHQEYAKLWEQSAEERAADNRALIDLEPLDRTQLPNGRWELRAERQSAAVSKIREGDRVLISEGNPLEGEVGQVETLTRDRVVVTVDEPVQCRRLDVYPSEFSVDRMLTAVYDAVLKGDKRRKDILFERADPAFSGAERTYIDNNAAQNDAVNAAVRAEDCALIHGPPGTGKTYTIARTIRALVEQGERVLVSAFTNRAVDNVLDALGEQGFEEFLRVGTTTGIRDDMLDARLDTRAKGAAEKLAEAPVVAATTASCGSRTMREQEFDVAIVDEAGQLTEPDTLAALNRADRFVLVGDHRQLPAVTKTEPAESLFERLLDTYPEAGVMLTEQYRMAQRIQAFPSQEFYDGQLRPATVDVASQSLTDILPNNQNPPQPLADQAVFIDIQGTATENANPAEADAVATLIESLTELGLDTDAIGVIAPFRAQVATITQRVPAGVTVDTVDRFQGSSKPVIILSFVATGELTSPVFEDHRRLNVALTRAQAALFMLGHRPTLETDPVYARLIDWASKGRLLGN